MRGINNLEETKVSIILPIYNGEKFIKKTIDSLITQSFTQIEIICVNDGSKDNTIKILNELAEKDTRIKIIDKKNEGVWKARFDGIKNANGKYITFVDSDDFVEENYIEAMYKNIEQNQSDFVVCGFKRIDYNTNKVLSNEMKYSSEKIIDADKNFEEVISINTAIWNKMFKASILKNLKNIEKPPRILEDMMFLALVYLNVKKISFVDDYLYNYIVREGSAMNVLKKEEISEIQDAMLEVKQHYINSKCTDSQIEILSAMAFLHFGISLMLRVSEQDKEFFNKQYKQNLSYLNKEFPQWKKTKYLKLIYNFSHKSSNLKVAIVKKIYLLNLFKIFISTYKFVTSKLKIDIKW